MVIDSLISFYNSNASNIINSLNDKVYFANQLICFYMIANMVLNKLRRIKML